MFCNHKNFTKGCHWCEEERQAPLLTQGGRMATQTDLLKKFESKISVIPQHLQYATSTKGMKYAELLGALTLMDKERCLKFTHEEFTKDYGAHGIAGLKGVSKKAKLPFVLRIVTDDKFVIIFKNDIFNGAKT